MGKKKKILIVDDECLNAMALGEYLEEIGYIIAGYATTGEEAVQTANETDPDIILLDIRLPGTMDGLEAADIISRHHEVPIIIISGYTEKILSGRNYRFKPFAFLSKPVDFIEVGNIIKTIK